MIQEYGPARNGGVWLGPARSGAVRYGRDTLIISDSGYGQARPGGAGPGAAWQGEAGIVY
jgi:hypothetical protein